MIIVLNEVGWDSEVNLYQEGNSFSPNAQVTCVACTLHHTLQVLTYLFTFPPCPYEAPKNRILAYSLKKFFFKALTEFLLGLWEDPSQPCFTEFIPTQR